MAGLCHVTRSEPLNSVIANAIFWVWHLCVELISSHWYGRLFEYKKKKNQGKANSVSEAGGAAEKLVSFQLWYRCTFKVTLKPFSPRARLKASAGGFEWIIIIIIFSFWLVVVWLIVHDCFLFFLFLSSVDVTVQTSANCCRRSIYWIIYFPIRINANGIKKSCALF